MSLINEIVAIETYIKTLYPTLTFVRQNVPLEPTAGTFITRYQTGSSTLETGYHYANYNEYQLVYFGSSTPDILTKMSELKHKVMSDLVIPFNDGSLRYIRIEGFTISQPFETENGVDTIFGILQTTTRTARDQATYEKMMSIYARYE